MTDYTTEHECEDDARRERESSARRRVNLWMPRDIYKKIMDDCATTLVQRGANAAHIARRKKTPMKFSEWILDACRIKLNQRR